MQSQVDLQTAESFCNSGNELKSQGKLNEAIASYQKALELQPDYSEVHHNLAEVYLMQRRLAEAGTSCKLALKLQPDFAAAYKTLGNILQAQGKVAEALRAYSKALDINPNFVEALVNKGTMLSKQGQPEEAIASYQKAIELKPDLAPAYWNLGNILMQQQRWDEAVPCWQKVLELKPELLSATALNDLGTTLGKQGKIKEAIASYQKAIELKIDYGLAYFKLGTLIKPQGKVEEAIGYLYKAIQFKPDYAESYNQLGSALTEQGRFEEAIACYQKGLKFFPNSSQFFCSIGNTLTKQNKLDEAIAQFQKAIELQSDFSEAYCNLGLVIFRKCMQEGQISTDKLNSAIDCFQKAIECKPELLQTHLNIAAFITSPSSQRWNYKMFRELADKFVKFGGEIGKIIAGVAYINIYIRSGLNQIAKDKFVEIEPEIYNRLEKLSQEEIGLIYTQIVFHVNYLRDDLEANSKLGKAIGTKYVEKLIKPKIINTPTITVKADREKPLNIGFLSGHFARHSVGWCSYDIIRELTNVTPNIYLYGTNERKSDNRYELFQKVGKKFYQAKKFTSGVADAKEIIQEILKDEIDVLIDLDSLTVPVQVEIIYRKPAPICMSWLGFEPPFVDENNYFLCDWHTHPVGTEQYNREKLIRMPDSFVAVSGFECQSVERKSIRKGLRLAEDQVAFLCIAPAYKLNPELIEAQVKIIKNVPDSVLLYKAHTGDSEVTKEAYQKKFQEMGIGLQRLKLLPLASSEEEHRTVYQIADIMLDSYPYNGGTHNLEALWFNLPVITRTGEQHLSRMGYSFLRSLDISTGIAKSWEEYTDWGIQLGKNSNLRQSVRERLIESKQPETLASLWNPQKFARDMYAKLEELLAEKLSTTNN